jgi:hypothetical protein
MPSYISKGGVLVPAKEHAVLPHLSGTSNEVYDGPDRAAEKELAEAYGVDENGKPKQGYFGIDYRHDPDMIMRARQLGYKSVDEFAAAMGYTDTPEEAAAEIAKKEKIVNDYKVSAKKVSEGKLGGGTDTSGQGNDKMGNFGNDPDGFSK